MKDIDREIAEKVMGWRSLFTPTSGSRSIWITEDKTIFGEGWHPSTDIYQAWMALVKFTKKEGKALIINTLDDCNLYTVSNFTDEGLPAFGWTWEDDPFTEEAEEAPLAICKALLRC